MENWLILETSGRVGQVGLACNGAVVTVCRLDDRRRHARDLAATVEQVLQSYSVAPAKVTGVLVGRGPGSYTGLRVGIISAKAFAYATGCHLIAIDTFAAIAEQAPAEAEQLWVIADALQGQMYLQPFARQGTVWLAQDELRIVPAERWLPSAPPGIYLSGPGVAVYAHLIPSECMLVPQPNREPWVQSLFAVGRRFSPLTRAELFALEPLYLRGSSAEEKAKCEGRSLPS
jgi:tRNA threonylcarbamoyladenosine biosynthesis protein TsaB